MANQATHDENSLLFNFDFMALPKEISNMVYEYALVRGKIFVPSVRSKDLNAVGPDLDLERDTRGTYIPFKSRDWRNERYPRYKDYEYYRYGPPIAAGLLQGVCKKVQSEAEAVFYGLGNHFVLPAGYYRNPPVFRDGSLSYCSPAPIPPFKSLSVTFDFRDEQEDLSGKDSKIRSQRDWYFPMRDDNTNAVDRSGRQMDGKERTLHVHDERLNALFHIWGERIRIIEQCVGLKYLEVDLEECYCPLGCCRMAESVVGTIYDFPARSDSLKHLNITGISSVEEAYELMNAIECAQGVFLDELALPVISLFLADQVTVEGMNLCVYHVSKQAKTGFRGLREHQISKCSVSGVLRGVSTQVTTDGVLRGVFTQITRK